MLVRMKDDRGADLDVDRAAVVTVLAAIGDERIGF